MSKKTNQIEEIIEEETEQIKYEKQERVPDWRGRKVVSIVDRLEYCKKLDCKKRDICGELQYGEGFEIIGKHRHEGKWFYEVKDNKETYFVTANNQKVVVVE